MVKQSGPRSRPRSRMREAMGNRRSRIVMLFRIQNAGYPEPDLRLDFTSSEEGSNIRCDILFILIKLC
jgi:hypothetical protein